MLKNLLEKIYDKSMLQLIFKNNLISNNNISDKKDYYLYFLLFFTPLINFIINNLIYYNIDYFWIIIIIFSFIFILIIILSKAFSISKLRLEIFVLLFFYLWYFQFFYRNIYNYFNLDLDGDLIQKYLITLFLILISILSLFLNKFKKFNIFIKSFLIISILLYTFSNFFNLKASDWKYKINKQVFPIESINKNLVHNKQNIYFFLMDEMTSARIYKNLGLDLSDDIEKFKKYGYSNLYNSLSNYNSSQFTIGAIFNMDYYPSNISIREESFYPYNLYGKEKPLLLQILEKSKFNFWYLDNQFQYFEKNLLNNQIYICKKIYLGSYYKKKYLKAHQILLYKTNLFYDHQYN